MSKVIINSKLISKNDKDYLKDYKGLMNDNSIIYNHSGIQSKITIDGESVIIKRISKEADLTLSFKENESLDTDYIIKDVGIVKVTTNTKHLMIKENEIMIEYDIYMNGVYSDTFEYNLKWSDVK